MWSGINKRKFPRAQYKCKVAILGESSDVNSTDLVTENIGVGGLCFLINKKLPLFSELDVELSLDPQKAPILCKGKVMWVVRQSSFDKSEEKYDTGIEFVGMSDNDKKIIEQLISGKK